ncbi:glycosyltransferase family 4 protein [bacterium]|nr:glycosyltransferase family 4 protein [bacterium]
MGYLRNVQPASYLRSHCPSLDGVIAVSKHVLLSIRSALRNTKIDGAVIHNGLDAGFWVRETKDKFLSDRSQRITFVGRLHETKGAHIVLRAMKYVRHRYGKAQLVIIGATSHDAQTGQLTNSRYEAALQKLAHGLGPGSVLLAGNLPPNQIVQRMANASIGVVPSLWEEPFGMTVIEGMAGGLPMICSRRGGIPEIITHEKDGILIDNYLDPEEWAKQIVRLLDDEELRTRLGHNARQTVLERFTIDQMARDFRSYIEKFL